jgi:hypothetical protein
MFGRNACPHIINQKESMKQEDQEGDGFMFEDGTG